MKDHLATKKLFKKLKSGYLFGESTQFETICSKVELDASDVIFQNGLTVGKADEYSWVEEAYGTDIGGVIEMTPMKLTEPIEGYVKFSFSGLKFLALRKFYFIEVAEHEDYSILKILVTHKYYPDLKKFNPFLETKAPSKTGTLPIVFFQGNWYKYTSLQSGDGKNIKLKISFLLDSIPPQVRLYCDYINLKTDNTLLDLFQFFCKLSKYHGTNGIVYEGSKVGLYKLISCIGQCHCDTDKVHTLPFMDKIGCINKALSSIDFTQAFDSGSVQSCDYQHVNMMDLIFLRTSAMPYPQTMMNVILKAIMGMEEKKSFSAILGIFLKHFLTQEAKLTAKINLIAYLNTL